MSDAMMTRLAALADRYAVEREIGHGGMATVYRARDLKHDRLVAIKVLRPELAQAMGAERFMREITIASQLQSPHILPLLDSGSLPPSHPERSEGSPALLYYVMPLVDGESLRDLLARDGALPPSEATRLLREIVDGLAHAHRRGVVHRDIKPDNVMLAERHALLMDFGVAKALADGRSGGPTGSADPHVTLTEVGISLGTPTYMAPEQAAADPNIDHRADIYAVGVMAYEMLTGAPPFTGAPQLVIASHITKAPAPIASVTPDVPPALAAIVMRCLAKDPGARYQTADDLLQAIEGLVTPGAAAVSPKARRRRVALSGLAVVVLVVIGGMMVRQNQRTGWVHSVALPEMQRLYDVGQLDSALFVAEEALRIAPEDSLLWEMIPNVARRVYMRTDPAGATVSWSPAAGEPQWRVLGVTPDTMLLPRTLARFRITMPGYRTRDMLTTAPWGRGVDTLLVLDPVDAPNAEMVRVEGGGAMLAMPGLSNVPPLTLDAFLIDRHEVTNREYKAFVDAGGYTNPEYWQEPITSRGATMSVAELLPLLVDRTGRPGPASWEGGTFAPGAEELPVGGVSWYEAAAYARFVGKALPTIYHWSRAAGTGAMAAIVTGSNFGSPGPRPGSTSAGLSPYGAFDMAGNVREWCANAFGQQRFILGGGWTDLSYAFVDAYAQDPLDRSPINGLRLMRTAASDATAKEAWGPLVRQFRDYAVERPVDDATYRVLASMHAYDKVPLDLQVESRDTSHADYIAERITIANPYGRDRLPITLFIPRGGTVPKQAVIYFPGSGAFYENALGALQGPGLDAIVQSGRVVVWPEYAGTYSREHTLLDDSPREDVTYRDHVVKWVTDLRRTMDFLATRPDVDSTRIAYYGFSFGGRMAPIMLALEPRFRAAVLTVAGLKMERTRPEADPINFLPRVRIPLLMLNGKYDHYFPLETSQKPFFALLGTPAADKRHVVYEGGHQVTRTMLLSETLTWLDKYLGKVQ